MKLFLIIFMTFCISAYTYAARPLGSAEPKEPKAPRAWVDDPDEPFIDKHGTIQLDDLRIKEPYDPIDPIPRDIDIFKLYEKEPQVDVFEPELRFYDKNKKEPTPIIIAPDGELYFQCPKGLKCK